MLVVIGGIRFGICWWCLAASSVVEHAWARGSMVYALVLHIMFDGARGRAGEARAGWLRGVVERGVDLTELDERGSRGSSMW